MHPLRGLPGLGSQPRVELDRFPLLSLCLGQRGGGADAWEEVTSAVAPLGRSRHSGGGRCPGAVNLSRPGALGRLPPVPDAGPPHAMSLVVWQGHHPHETSPGCSRDGGVRTEDRTVAETEQESGRGWSPAGSDPVTRVHGSPRWAPCTSVGSVIAGPALGGGGARPPVCSALCARL